jgi:hypothetical protein
MKPRVASESPRETPINTKLDARGFAKTNSSKKTQPPAGHLPTNSGYYDRLDPSGVWRRNRNMTRATIFIPFVGLVIGVIVNIGYFTHSDLTIGTLFNTIWYVAIFVPLLLVTFCWPISLAFLFIAYIMTKTGRGFIARVMFLVISFIYSIFLFVAASTAHESEFSL